MLKCDLNNSLFTGKAFIFIIAAIDTLEHQFFITIHYLTNTIISDKGNNCFWILNDVQISFMFHR